MTLTGNDHVSAMKRMAVSIPVHTAVAAVPEDETEETLVAALRYDASFDITGTQKTVRWVLAFRDEQRKPQTDDGGEFDATGMSKSATCKKVLFLALERLMSIGHPDVRLAMSQNMGAQFRDIRDLVPNIKRLPVKYKVGKALDKKAEAGLRGWRGERDRLRMQYASAKVRAERLGNLSTERTVYIDASTSTKKRLVGIGYVVKDVESNPNTGKETWLLRFGSGNSYANPRGGSTLAELTGIWSVLVDDQKVINDDISDNLRSLTVVCDSKWGVEVLNSMRNGTPIEGNFDVHPTWTELGERIINHVARIKDVQFQWVKGHSVDALNNAADRLALSTRRHIDFNNPDDALTALQAKIAAETIDDLKLLGITAVALSSHATTLEI